MTDYDYIVSFDETGQPYIEHFSFQRSAVNVRNRVGSAYNAARAKAAGVQNYGVGRGVRQNHKYIAKIGNRYIYDAKELAAMKANQAKSATKNAVANAKKTINRNAVRVRSSASNIVQDAKRSVRKTTGLEARERAKNAKSDGRTYNGYSTMEALDYSRTPLGKVEKAIDQAKYKAKNNAVAYGAGRVKYGLKRLKGTSTYKVDGKEVSRKEFNQAVGSAVKNAAKARVERTKEDIKTKTNSVKDKVKDTSAKAKEKVKDIVGVDERERRDAAVDEYKKASAEQRNANRVYSRSVHPSDEAEYKKLSPEERERVGERLERKIAADRNMTTTQINKNAAQKEYNKTPLGMLEKVNEGTVGKIKEKVEQLENERRHEQERVNTETERRREEQRRREEEERRRRQAAENEIERQRREGG